MPNKSSDNPLGHYSSFAQDWATLPIIDFKFSEKAIIGSRSMPEGYAPILELVLAGKLPRSRLVSHRLPLEQAEKGLRLTDAEAENVIKVVIEPHGDSGAA